MFWPCFRTIAVNFVYIWFWWWWWCVCTCVRACVCVRVNVPNGDRIDCSQGRHSHRSFKGKGTLAIWSCSVDFPLAVKTNIRIHFLATRLLLIAFIWRYSPLSSRLSALLYAILNGWLSLFIARFWISAQVVYLQRYLVTSLVSRGTAAVSAHVLRTPCNHAPVYSVTSFQAVHVGCMCVHV